MKNNPIGVFDSGVGGLTTLKEIKNIMPHENIVYFGDTLHMPYGNKDKSQIIKYTSQILKFLKSLNLKVILSACGTISSYINLIDKEVFGVIKPACVKACSITKNKKVGIIATNATIKRGAYKENIYSIDSSISCFQNACPLLASLIESGHIKRNDKLLIDSLKLYLEPLLLENVDTIVLGCTHYPIVEDVIKAIVGNKINLINVGKELAVYVKKHLEENNLCSQRTSKGFERFCVSSDIENFKKNARLFLGNDFYISEVEKVNL